LSFWAGMQEGQPWYEQSNRLLSQLPLALNLADASDAHGSGPQKLDSQRGEN